ncbi:MAG: pilus assembly protein TadG-related protein [Gemmatimonadaceae bacterium]
MRSMMRNRRGATMVLVAVLLTVLLGFGAFAVDLTQQTTFRSELQRASDAAALAGAVQLTKPNYDQADEQASAFSGYNKVMGQNPTVNALDYGTWANNTFTRLGCSPGCSTTDAQGANAFRVIVSGTGGPILSQFVGRVGQFSMQTQAVAIVANSIIQTNCLKPFAVDYRTLTGALNTARNQPGLSLTRDLDATDLNIMRTNPTALKVCLKEGSGQATCSNPGARYPGNFNIVNLDPGDGGANDYEANISSCSAQQVGIGSHLEVETGNKVGKTITGKNAWCAQFGSSPCTMKAALWLNPSPGNSTATTGKNCKNGQTGSGWCREVKLLGSFVITSAGDQGNGGNAGAVIEGYFTALVTNGTIGGTGSPAGPLDRLVLVQ